MGMLRMSVAFLLHLAASLAAPVPCEEKVVRLEAEIQGLMNVIDDQHRYIQELHNSQTQQLEHIPNSHLGPENLYKVLNRKLRLRVDMEDFEGITLTSEYTNFKVDDEKEYKSKKYCRGFRLKDIVSRCVFQGFCRFHQIPQTLCLLQRQRFILCFYSPGLQDQYQLHLGDYTGNAGNSLAGPGSGSSRVKFRTYDRLNDGDAENNGAECIRHSKSGWWFSRCDSGNLNGHYYKGPHQAMTDDGVVWYTWHGWWYSIKSVVMMVRAADLEHLPPVLTPLPGQLEPSTAAGNAVGPPQGQ
ncbi:angiopoietin-4-like [Morone saxatilis]|uniref:angiopoietin-4-like n=1 Tax=Morone saxatilis TaxID=34816 RepID=UPI0015E253A2|nr:angiopoietin-4-like [Morone saxatilis]